MTHINATTWFELPTTDLARAAAFYENILATKLHHHTDDPTDPMFIFPASPEGVKGALIQRTLQKPGPGGATVYLNVTGALDGALARVPKAGGRVLVPLTNVPGGPGAYACLRDPEGNVVGLHTTS